MQSKESFISLSYIYRGIGDRSKELVLGMIPVVGAGEWGTIRLVLGGGLGGEREEGERGVV